jgi:hypothetical protein
VGEEGAAASEPAGDFDRIGPPSEVCRFPEPTSIRTTREYMNALLLAACLLLGSSSLASAEGPAVSPVSVIQIPLELDLGPLVQAADSSLPTQAGHWPGWHKWHGIDARYRAWRGPLWLAMQGGVLQAQAHVRYQLQARKGLIGDVGLTVGCGVDEPPRQALIGVLVRLDWEPDWSLHPLFRVLPTRFLDPCEVTVADIDVSPLVGKVFEGRIEKTLMEAMHALAPRLTHLRGEAARAWQGMQAPREVIAGLWLHIQPLRVALAPPQGAGSRVQTTLWLLLRAWLSADPGPTTAPTPLPPLAPHHPSPPGLRFALALELDYPAISAALGERLVGQSADMQGQKARLDGVSLSAKGEDLVLVAELSGDLTGWLTIMARPGFDTATQTLRLKDVDFIFDAADPNQELMANLFYDRIRARIEAEVNSFVAERTKGLQDALMAMLAAGLAPTLAPDLSNLRIAELRFRVGEQGLTLVGTVDGVLKLGRSHSPDSVGGGLRSPKRS